MDEQRGAVISASANISTSDIMPHESGVRETGRSGFTIVRLVLGVLLLTTAGLKLFDPSPDTFSTLDLLSSGRWGMVAIVAEALLGLWLLTGALPRLLWLSALLGFTLLASASLYMGIEGQASCHCFGAKVPVNPWYAMSLDMTAVASLLWWRPLRQTSVTLSAPLRRALLVMAGAGAILILGLGGLSWIYGSPDEALIHLRGESITIDPQLTDVGEGQRLEKRSFTVLLTNQTDHAIRITGGTADCSCIATDDLPLVLQPKESRSIVIQFEFRGRPGSFQRSFRLYTEEERQPLIIARIKGRMLKPD